MSWRNPVNTPPPPPWAEDLQPRNEKKTEEAERIFDKSSFSSFLFFFGETALSFYTPLVKLYQRDVKTRDQMAEAETERFRKTTEKMFNQFWNIWKTGKLFPRDFLPCFSF